MQTIVLDTSAAVELILGRTSQRIVKAILEQSHLTVVPQLFIAEICNVFWKLNCFQKLPEEDCIIGTNLAINLVDEFVELNELRTDAFTLAAENSIPVYDMFFLTLAIKRKARLVTMDKKLNYCARKYSVKTLHSKM